MIFIENKKYWIWLSLIRKLDNKTKMKLLERFNSPERIYMAKECELLKYKEINASLISDINFYKNEELINKHIEYMKKSKINIININDVKYPKNLKEIYDPPVSLFIKGDENILNGNNIGIVGCRECTEYGRNAAKYFSYNLSNKAFNIVSGLAKGIDSYSHIGCLIANRENFISGKTIAVVGNGLDVIYPRDNIELERNIIKNGGAIISEYPCGTKPEKMNFPARNRIISGISKGIIVVEAKEKSGTLITVDFALEQGRDIYVVPGNINSINSVGTNELIKQGAKLISNYYDIITT